MANLVIGDELARKLQKIAERENRSVEDVIKSSVDTTYPSQSSSSEEIQAMLDKLKVRSAETSPLEAFIGMFDDDVTDASTTVRETMKAYYLKKYGDK